MNVLERFGSVFLIAGLAFFALSVVAEAWLPHQMLRAIPKQTVEEVAARVTPDFEDLAARYPEAFKTHFGEPTPASFARALRLGRDVYIAEGCWHCHSQFVRPVSNEDRRWGAVSYPAEYQNALQLPQLFGTRRVGPDLCREAGRHSNDWQAAHFWNPTDVVPTSVMPRFSWFFDSPEGAEPPRPNEKGLAMIAYVQWLGSWAERPDAPLLFAPPVAAKATGGPRDPIASAAGEAPIANAGNPLGGIR